MASTNPTEQGMALVTIQASLTLEQALSQPDQISALRKHEPVQLQLLISALLEQLTRSFSVKNTFTPEGLYECAMLIIEKYWYLRPEEVMFAFKRAKMGEYGTSYNRLDTQTVLEWLHRYDTQHRQQFVEQMQQQVRDQQQQEQEAAVAALLEHPASPVQSKPGATQRADGVNEKQKELGFQRFQLNYYEQKRKPTPSKSPF